MKRGCLISFEGLDGSGKSTQLERIAARLRERRHSVVTTFEPTDGPIGRRIREMARSGEAPPPETELAWFLEDRQQHVDEFLKPAVDRGDIVLCDRYTLSSVAYQGARGLDPTVILAESEERFPLPDLALVFEVSAEVGLARVDRRGGPRDAAFEQRDFLERVAEIFEGLDRPYIERIDAVGEPDEVEARVLDRVTQRLGL